MEAAEFLEAEKEERAGNFQSVKELHYQHIKEVEKEAKKAEEQESQNRKEAEAKIEEKEKKIAKKFRELQTIFKDDKDMSKKIAILQKVYKDGRYSSLPDLHKKMVDSKDKETMGATLNELYEKYHNYAKTDEADKEKSKVKGFQIISSVTFE